jgi:hypothetical protein
MGYDAGKVVCVEKNDTWTIVGDVISLKRFLSIMNEILPYRTLARRITA